VSELAAANAELDAAEAMRRGRHTCPRPDLALNARRNRWHREHRA
jgi:hypothetical protein